MKRSREEYIKGQILLLAESVARDREEIESIWSSISPNSSLTQALQRRRLSPSTHVPDEIIQIIISFTPWFRLITLLRVSSAVNKTASEEIVKQFNKLVKTKLPRICIGKKRKKKDQVRTTSCMHKELDSICFARHFIPHMTECDQELVAGYNKCEITDAIQRPTKYLIVIPYRQNPSVMYNRFNENPKWLCNVTHIDPIKKKNYQSGLKKINRFLTSCISQMKSCYSFRWQNFCRKYKREDIETVKKSIEKLIDKVPNIYVKTNWIKIGRIKLMFKPLKIQKLYNMRNWLTGIEGKLFYFDVRDKMYQKNPQSIEFVKYF